MAKKRVILANEDEPKTGDYMYGLYDRTHPVFGQKDEIARMRRELRGLGGSRVTLTLNGSRIDEETGEEKRIRIRRTFTMNTYRDIFGPGSAYASAIHSVREKHSGDVIITHSLTIEETDMEEDSDE